VAIVQLSNVDKFLKRGLPWRFWRVTCAILTAERVDVVIMRCCWAAIEKSACHIALS